MTEVGELVCPFCREIFKNPVQLIACKHHLCEGCVQSQFDSALLLRNAEAPQIPPAAVFLKGEYCGEEDRLLDIDCPVCRVVTKIPPETGLKLLKPNLELGQKCDKALGTKEPCESCKAEAQIDCETCGWSFCTKCFDLSHAVPIMKRHVQVPVGSNKAARIQERVRVCSQHSIDLNLFCVDDQKLVCATCSVEEHAEHKCVTLDVAGKTMSDELERARQAIDELRASLESRVAQFQDNKAAIIAVAKKTRGEATRMFDELLGTIQRYKAFVLDTIDACAGIVGTQHQALHNLIQKSRAVCKTIQTTKDSTDASTQSKLAVKQQAISLQKTLEKVKLDQPIDVKIQPQIEHSLDIPEILEALDIYSLLSYPYSRWSLIVSRNHAVGASFRHLTRVAFSKPPTLRLLYRGSRDGFTPQAFHSKCDEKNLPPDLVGPTLTIIQSAEGFVFGGYSKAPWRGAAGNYVQQPASDVFIFSLKGPSNNTKPALFRPNKNPLPEAIYDHSNYGPTFGGGHDLYVHSDGSHYSSLGSTYQPVSDTRLANIPANGNTLAGQSPCKIAEIEVFSCK
eukprot:c18301_g1_i2.p1 GENE.c18301_g1_i2~~c18301_g1_i2.p1  ORF type:complete len:576 (+),score=119.36 c18301_g1_i2:33-1730(+)